MKKQFDMSVGVGAEHWQHASFSQLWATSGCAQAGISAAG